LNEHTQISHKIDHQIPLSNTELFRYAQLDKKARLRQRQHHGRDLYTIVSYDPRNKKTVGFYACADSTEELMRIAKIRLGPLARFNAFAGKMRVDMLLKPE